MGDESSDIRQRLAEFSEVNEEARYRDKLLYGTYYLSLILMGVLIQVSVTMYKDESYVFLSVTALVGSYSFFLLSTWAFFVRESRDSALIRRKEIETSLEPVNLGEVFEDDDKPPKQDVPLVHRPFYWLKARNGTDLIRVLLFPLSVLWFLVFTYVALVHLVAVL